MSTRLQLADQVRSRLRARRAELLSRQRRVIVDLTHQAEPLAADFSEQAVQLENDAALRVIGSAALQEMADIDAALERLGKGLFGVCKECGGEISLARLDAAPYAITCERCLR